MTDARFPERWLNDRRILRLSDAAHRLFVTALAWSVSNRTDGVIDDDDLPLIPGVDVDRARELDRAGLWDRYSDHWLILDYDSTQTTRDQLDRLDRVRRAEREKKARQRERKAAREDVEQVDSGNDGDCPPALSPGTVPRDDTGQDRQGKDRQGALEAGAKVCVDCGSTRSLLAGRDSRFRCRRHHDWAAA
jgi:hypothetical protein